MKRKIFLLFILVLLFPCAFGHAWEELNRVFKCESPVSAEIPTAVTESPGRISFTVKISNKKMESTEKCPAWRKELSNSSLFLLNGNTLGSNVSIFPEKQTIGINETMEFTVTLDGINSLSQERTFDFRFFSDQSHIIKSILLKLPQSGSPGKPSLSLSPDFNIVFATATEPDEVAFKPGKENEFKLFLRNASNTTLHNVTVNFIESDFEFELKPLRFEEMKPSEIRAFTLTSNVPVGKPLGQYKARIEITSDEFPFSLTRDVWILLVLEEQALYFYAAVAVIVFALFLFRVKTLQH